MAARSETSPASVSWQCMQSLEAGVAQPFAPGYGRRGSNGLQRAFFNALRVVIGVPGGRKLIMSRIARFPTARGSRHRVRHPVPGT